MSIKKLSLPIFGVLAVSAVGLVASPVTQSASASADLYEKVEEHYEIAGHNMGTDWEMVTSLDDLEDEQIVTLAAIDTNLDEDPVTVVANGWSLDHDYISTWTDGSISGTHLNSDSASYLMFDRATESRGHLSTLENGINEPIGCFLDEDEFFQLTPTYDNSSWSFSFDEATHKVTIYQIISGKTAYLVYLNGCEQFLIMDDPWFASSVDMYLFKDNFVHSGTRKLSDVKRDGSSLIYDFSVALLDTFDGVCMSDGSTDADELDAAVISIYMSDESNALRQFSKNVFKHAVADENGDVVQRAAALYDYIMLKYNKYIGYEWFGRAEYYPSSSNQASMASNNAGVIVISTIVATTLLGFAVLCISKKKSIKE